MYCSPFSLRLRLIRSRSPAYQQQVAVRLQLRLLRCAGSQRTVSDSVSAQDSTTRAFSSFILACFSRFSECWGDFIAWSRRFAPFAVHQLTKRGTVRALPSFGKK